VFYSLEAQFVSTNGVEILHQTLKVFHLDAQFICTTRCLSHRQTDSDSDKQIRKQTGIRRQTAKHTDTGNSVSQSNRQIDVYRQRETDTLSDSNKH